MRKRPRVAPTVAEDENAAEQGDIVATQVASVGSERSGERSAAVPSPEAAGPPAAVGSSPGAASPGAASPGAGSSSAPEPGAASPSSGLSAAPQEERQDPLASQATVSDSIATLPSRMERLNAQMAQNLAPVVAGPGGTALKEGEDWWDLDLDESREYKTLEEIQATFQQRVEEDVNRIVEKAKYDPDEVAKALKELAQTRIEHHASQGWAKSQGDAVGDDEEPAEVIFWKRIAANNFNVPTDGRKDPVAGRWQRWVESNPDHALAKEYKNCKKPATRAEVRKKWAKMQWDQSGATKTKTESHETTEGSDGRKISLERMAWLEGGGKNGLRNAVNYALMAQSLGAPWFTWDKWTKSDRYLYTNEIYRDIGKKAWPGNAKLFASLFCLQFECPCIFSHH